MDPSSNLETDSDGSGCFMSCESAGGWPASDVGDDVFSCSTHQ
jgi:hypothetical protein